MRKLASGALAVGAALALVAACGGGGGGSATTTSAPAPSDETTTSSLPTTTTTAIDPVLRDLLLVADDLPAFKEKAPAPTTEQDTTRPCDPATAPAVNALEDAPSAEGATFVRGADDAVEVTSEVTSASPEQAEAALDELQDRKVLDCLESGFRTELEKSAPGGDLTLEVTSSKATLEGIDQVVLLTGAVTTKSDTGAERTQRLDFVFLRSAGTVLAVSYSGPTSLATSAERQRIVGIAARKLAGAASGGTTTTAGAGGSSTSSTSSGRRTTTTRRSTSTTRSGGSTSTRASSTTTSTR